MLSHKQFIKDLELDPVANLSPEALKKQWRTLCQKYHPDHEGGDRAKFDSIMHAYKMLTDPSYQYEESERTRGHQGDLDVVIQIPISFDAAFFGRSMTVSFGRNELSLDGKLMVDQEKQEIITLVTDLPAGSLTGHVKKFYGKGLKCGDTFGDVEVNFRPAKHPRFESNGVDIVAIENVPLEFMLTGGDMDFMTMYGMKTARIPAGSRPGERVAIPKCGVQQIGNHVVVLSPIFPSKEDLKRGTWRNLNIDWDAEKKRQDEDSQEAEYERTFRKGRPQFSTVDLTRLFEGGL